MKGSPNKDAAYKFLDFAFINSPRWMTSLKNSMIIGIASTMLSMVLGTLAALGLAQWKSRFKPLVLAFVLSPVVVPGVITAVGLYFFFAPIGLTGSYLGLILAHTALATPFVVITVGATLQSFDMNLSRAAVSLGASPLYACGSPRRLHESNPVAVELPVFAPPQVGT